MEKKVKKGLFKKVVSNIFYSGLTGIISKIGAFLFTIIIARTFFPEFFGVYSLALTIILTLVVISDLGLGSTMTRFISESIGNKNQKQARSRFQFLFRFKLIFSLFISVLLFIFSGIISTFFKEPSLVLPLKIGSLYLFLNIIYEMFTSIFLSLQKLKYSAIGEGIFQVSRIGLLFASFYFFNSVEGVFLILSLSLILPLIFSFGVILRKYGFLVKGKREPVERKRMLKFSGFLALGSFTVIIFSNVDKLVLGYFLSSNFIGYYTAIFTIVSGVLGLLGMASVLLPFFTQLKEKMLDSAFKKSFHYLSLVAFPATFGLAFIIFPLVGILYGAEYVPPEYTFSLLITSILLSLLILETTFSSFYKILFDAKEKPKFPALIVASSSFINLILNVVLVLFLTKIDPSYGLIGASAATVISRYAGMFAIFSVSKNKFGLIPKKESLVKPIILSLLMLGYLFLFKSFVTLNIFTGIIMVLSAASIYLAMALLIKAISIEEIKKIFSSI